jgi:ParB/RepB/Spo0J family partition protein
MSTIVNETKNVEFNRIHVPEEENARTVYEGIEDLATDIKQHGLLQGLVVTNGGSGDKPYRLVAGFRRAAALKLLKWGDKTVPVTIVEAQGRVIKNLIENIHRNDLRTADLAQRLFDLERGDYPREKGEEVIKYTKDELSAQLGLSISHVTNLIRAHANLADDVKKVWQKNDLPQNLVFKMAALTTKEEQVIELKDDKTGKKLKDEEGNVKTKTIKVTVPDDVAQDRMLKKWAKAKEAEELAAKGKKKGDTAAASAGGEGEGGEGDEGDVESNAKRPGKKVMAEFIEKASAKLK